MEDKKKYILIIISMCGMIASSVGLITNISGLFFVPIAKSFNATSGSVSLTLTISNIVFALGGMVLPKVMKEKNMKVVFMTATALLAGGTALLSISPNLFVMYILNAIRGFAGGLLGFVLATTVINNWFVASAALATSIVMSTSGFAGALFSPVVSGLIGSVGWRMAYVVVAIMMVILNLPAIFLLPSLDPSTKGYIAYGGATKTEKTQVIDDVEEKTREVNKVIFIFIIVYAVLACGATALPQHFPGIINNYSMAAAVGTAMVSICMIANSLGKIALGAMIDVIGARISLIIYSALALTSLFLLQFIRTPFTMYIAAALFGLTYALATVGPVVLTKEMFGVENYSKTYPTISLSGTISNAIFSSAVGFMYDAFHNYTMVLLLMFIMLGVNIFIILYSYQKRA